MGLGFSLCAVPSQLFHPLVLEFGSEVFLNVEVGGWRLEVRDVPFLMEPCHKGSNALQREVIEWYPG
jgi:hypothetical protein